MFDDRVEAGQVGQARKALNPDLLACLVLDFRNAIRRQKNAVAGLKGELR